MEGKQKMIYYILIEDHLNIFDVFLGFTKFRFNSTQLLFELIVINIKFTDNSNLQVVVS